MNAIKSYFLVSQDISLPETLRLWPPLPIADRECVKSFTIQPSKAGEKPVHLNKGDVIWVPTIAIHRDAGYYPNPSVFDPERFNEENRSKIEPCSYIPFGIGPRSCIGSRFALMEIKILFFHLLDKFQLVTIEKTQIPLKILKGSMNVVTEKGIWVGFKRREL